MEYYHVDSDEKKYTISSAMEIIGNNGFLWHLSSVKTIEKMKNFNLIHINISYCNENESYFTFKNINDFFDQIFLRFPWFGSFIKYLKAAYIFLLEQQIFSLFQTL